MTNETVDRSEQTVQCVELEVGSLKKRIKRLEEAGDALANTQTYDLLATVNWRKAKEAKL